MGVADMVGFIFVLLCLFLMVMTMKSLSSAISSRLGGSEEDHADNIGFCVPYLTALVPPCEKCTSVAPATLCLPEGHITVEADLSLQGSVCGFL
jgi:Na+-transporting methylmalonyl-CoA/oxaloacetate decarboxylase gamma subunit